MQAICTIITKSHLHFAKALHQSVKRFIDDIQMHVLIADDNDPNAELSGIHVYDTSCLTESKIGNKIHSKYYHKNMDHFRWSCKSVFMIYLLNNGVDNILYLDPDLFFFDDPTFLFKKLKSNSVLLSPHFRTNHPAIDYDDYGRNNTHGLFNGGFIGANKDGIPALEWWADVCCEVCEKNRKKGYYVDQSHLNLMPLLFEKIGILKNHGCNVASWNRNTSPRSLEDGEVTLNKKDRLVFIHFTNDTMRGILDGSDLLLKPYLKEYLDTLKSIEGDLSLIAKFKPSFWGHLINPSRSKYIKQQIASYR